MMKNTIKAIAVLCICLFLAIAGINNFVDSHMAMRYNASIEENLAAAESATGVVAQANHTIWAQQAQKKLDELTEESLVARLVDEALDYEVVGKLVIYMFIFITFVQILCSIVLGALSLEWIIKTLEYRDARRYCDRHGK